MFTGIVNLYTLLFWTIVVPFSSLRTTRLFVNGFSVVPGAADDSCNSAVILETIITTIDGSKNSNNSNNNNNQSLQDDDGTNSMDCAVSTVSDFQEANDYMSLDMYNKYTNSRHLDCMDLFDRYKTKVIRCSSTSQSQEQEVFNIRWEASWVGAGSVWLFDLADSLGWDIETRNPDPSRIAAFSWKNVFRVFQRACQTGTIQLPVFIVEGNTRLKVNKNLGEGSSTTSVVLTESIDLVREADLSRLQNRIVAQEFGSWLDVSRRPLKLDGDESTWASIVRKRILTNVPGAGPLDVDPNEDEGPDGVIAAFVFSAVIAGAFGLLYKFLADEIVGGTGQVSELCDDAVQLEFGKGYLSECFGPFGDGPFLK